MSLLKRISNLVRSNVNEILDKAEDPKKILLLDMAAKRLLIVKMGTNKEGSCEETYHLRGKIHSRLQIASKRQNLENRKQ